MRLRSLSTTILISLTLTVTACGGGSEQTPAGREETAAPAQQEETVTPSGTRADPYSGHGFIEEVREGELLIRHDTIPGFMAAMTMAYPLSDDVDIEGLNAGTEIQFEIERLEPQGYRVFRVDPVE